MDPYLHRRMRDCGILPHFPGLLTAEGDGSDGGGGSTYTGVSAEKYAAAVSREQAATAKIEALTSQVAELTEKVGEAGELGTQLEQLRAEVETATAGKTAAEERAQKLETGLRRQALIAALPGLRDPEYLKLAPDVTLAEDGAGLDTASVEAVKAWRSKHEVLFDDGGDARDGDHKTRGTTRTSARSQGAPPSEVSRLIESMRPNGGTDQPHPLSGIFGRGN